MQDPLITRLRSLLEVADGMRMSQELLDDEGVPRAAVAALRAGRLDGWTTTSAARLARVVGVDDREIWATTPMPGLPSTRHFSGGVLPVGPRDQAVIRGAASLTLALRRALAAAGGGALTELPAPQKPNSRSKVYEQGYRLALSARRRTGVRQEPLTPLVAWVEQSFQIPVLFVPFTTTRLEGVTVAAEGVTAILLDSSLLQRPLMLRRTLAHELCHALHDPRDAAGAFATWDAAGAPDDAVEAEAFVSEQPLEQRARAFAAELLVPSAGLPAVVGDRPIDTPGQAADAVRRVSERFLAPADLVRYHLENRGLIPKDMAWRSKGAVAPVEMETPGTWVFDTLRALVEDDQLSAGRARELLALVPGLLVGGSDALAA